MTRMTFVVSAVSLFCISTAIGVIAFYPADATLAHSFSWFFKMTIVVSIELLFLLGVYLISQPAIEPAKTVMSGVPSGCLSLDPFRILRSNLPVIPIANPTENEIIRYAEENPWFITMLELGIDLGRIRTPLIAVVKNGEAFVTSRKPDPTRKRLMSLAPWDQRVEYAIQHLGLKITA